MTPTEAAAYQESLDAVATGALVSLAQLTEAEAVIGGLTAYINDLYRKATALRGLISFADDVLASDRRQTVLDAVAPDTVSEPRILLDPGGNVTTPAELAAAQAAQAEADRLATEGALGSIPPG